MEYLVASYTSLPSNPGVYQFLDKHGSVLYVGKAKNLKKRVSSYFTGSLGEKTQIMISQAHKIHITIVESELESLLLEAALIKKLNPKYNSKLTDGKAYPLIRITKDAYPKVLTARRADDPKSLYFGPYPNVGAMRTVLKIIRRIFSFVNVLHHPKKPCLYYHLGLCPCPEVFDSAEIKTNYKKNIRHIIQFLNGEKTTILSELQKERDEYSKNEQFEDAQNVQKQIDAVVFVTSPTHKPFEYEINPNLREDLRTDELLSLQEELKKNGVTTNYPHRIECYDISNTSGLQATASLVVLTDGEIDKSQYRKFKIDPTIMGPNDFAMMKHTLKRRLKHSEWPTPDLIIVDGGKGQVSSALEALQEAQSSIPLVGLAKREEIIITSTFTEIKLPKSSKASLLVRRIRDEAHRFAVSYHRKLRSKAIFS